MKWIQRLITFAVYLVIYFPIIIIAILSVNASVRDFQFTGFSLRWYLEIVRDASLLRAIQNTLLIALLSTVIATVLGTYFSVVLLRVSKKMRLRLLMVNNVPVVNPDIVTGLGLLTVFSFIGIRFGFPSMLLAHVFFSVPFVVLTVFPKLKSLKKEVYEAALDLGAKPLNAWIKVVLPELKGAMIAGALIAFTMSIDDFVISYFVFGDGFNNVSIWLYSRLGRRTFSPAVYAYNTLIMSVTMVILIGISLKIRKGEKNEKIIK
jgi:spermidine/putrescine transport system permease protein